MAAAGETRHLGPAEIGTAKEKEPDGSAVERKLAVAEADADGYEEKGGGEDVCSV